MKRSEMLAVFLENLDNNTELLNSDILKNSKPLKKHLRKLHICFNDDIEDFRTSFLTKYNLGDILLTVFLAVIEGAKTYNEIADYALDRFDFLSVFVSYEKAPSHDTIRRILMNIDADNLNKVLVEHFYALIKKASKIYERIAKETNKKIIRHLIADGKYLNGTGRLHGTDHEVNNMMTLNYYDTNTNLCIFSIPIEEKKSEYTAFKTLLKSLDLTNSVLSLDALHTRSEITSMIAEKKGHYMLALKKNNNDFYEDILNYFNKNQERISKSVTSYLKDELEKSNNALIRREYFLINPDKYYRKDEWAKIKKIVVVRKTIEKLHINSKTEEIRLYITSLNDIEIIPSIIRGHWDIENKLHLPLDKFLGEDDSLISGRVGARNYSIFRKVALPIMKLFQHSFPNGKRSVVRTQKGIGRMPIENLIRLYALLDNKKILEELFSN